MADYIATTPDIQSLIDKASADGGGRVIIQGHIIAESMIILKSNVELHLPMGSVLEAPKNLDAYPDYEPELARAEDGFAPEKGRKCFIAADCAENIAITGNGTVEMNGTRFYDTTKLGFRNFFYEKPDYPRPRMLELVGCRNVHLENTSFLNSPSWSFWLVDCEEMFIRNIRLTGDPRLPNNDGIHMDTCRNVMISDCFISTGDDSIVVRCIRKRSDREYLSCGITITNCVLHSLCHGIRIGCPSDGIIRNVTVSNCVLTGQTGIGFGNPEMYLHNVKGRLFVESIRIQNVIVDVNGCPLSIYVDKGLMLEKLGDIRFTNCDFRGKTPAFIQGWEEFPIGPLVFNSARFNMLPQITGCKNLQFKDVEMVTE